ncbi:MAG: putative porin [Chthoniobacteraceae bacterium]|nr:putative porin [Chthoniobacteraceae bacterium]
MKNSPFLAAALALSLAFGAGPALAQDESTKLLDLLVAKKVLTGKEAETLRADLVKEKAASSAEKLKLSGPVTQLSLYGDARLRFQYDNLDQQLPRWDPVRLRWLDTGNGDQRDRFRFRLRLAADFQLKDDWFGGVQLQSSQYSDTGNQTFDGGFQNYGVYISRVYAGWRGLDWFTIIAGKQPNPFYTTDLLWDPDINPSGVVERVDFHKLLGCGGEEETIEYAPDGKTVVSIRRAPIECPWTLTLITGQFFFDDNQEFNPPGRNTDAYLFEEQLLFSLRFCGQAKFTLAPAYLRYNSAQVNTVWNQQGFAQVINGTGTDGLPLGWGETRDLSLIQVPGDVAFRLCGWKIKVFWDGVYNTDGAKRVNDIYVVPERDKAGNIVDFDRVRNHAAKDDFAWLAGIQFGDNAKKGDWALNVNYREVGLGAVDPNLNDSDWGLSRLNLRGWKASLGYNFTDAVVAQVSYCAADNLRSNLIGGQATGGAKLADANSVQVFQFDLNVKF